MSNVIFNSPLNKVAKSLDISFEVAKEMVAYDHSLKHLFKKTKSAPVELSKQAEKIINNVAKKLKISKEAVIAVYIFDYLQKNGGAE